MADEFQDRHRIESAVRPEVWQALAELYRATFHAAVLPESLAAEVFTVASLAAGCRHCQAHGAYGLAQLGIETRRIQALWSFQTSDEFTARERAALAFALAAGQSPSGVTPAHHAALREHFDETEIADLFVVVAMSGWLNRYNDSLATVTDEESVEWASANLAAVGWSPGKHRGAAQEQRKAHPSRDSRIARSGREGDKDVHGG